MNLQVIKNIKASLRIIISRGGSVKVKKYTIIKDMVREDANKKVLLLMAGPLRPNLPPPLLELNGPHQIERLCVTEVSVRT